MLGNRLPECQVLESTLLCFLNQLSNQIPGLMLSVQTILKITLHAATELFPIYVCACVHAFPSLYGPPVTTSQHQNQVFLNIHFTEADGLTVMCSFNGAPLQPCTSPHGVNITHLCTGNYSLVLVGFCNGREVHKVASTITGESGLITCAWRSKGS